MLLSSIPTKFNVPFASSAGVGFITSPIPVAPTSPGRASLQQGFPPSTFEPEASGGNPPFGADANGILNQITAWVQFSQAGGLPAYDGTFAGAIGGYPNTALLRSTAFVGHYWQSTVDNNASDPDTGGSNWVMFPDVLIQQQAGNWTPTDSGAVNAAAITLFPAPASWAAIEGAPIRFLIEFTNTTTAVTLNVNGLGAKTLKNTDGSAMVIGQLTAGGLVEGFYDGTNVQVASPGKPPPGGSSVLPPGAIVLCPVEVPFMGTLECDGTSYLRSAYPNLFNVIGTTYGAVDANHFNVPDMRGIFVRGWDHGRGLDPGAATRAAPGVLAPARAGATGAAGDHVGTTEVWTSGPLNNVKFSSPKIGWDAGVVVYSMPYSTGTSYDANLLPLSISFDTIPQSNTIPYSGPITNYLAGQQVFPNPPWGGGPFPPNNNSSISWFMNDVIETQSGIYKAIPVSYISGTLAGNGTETRPVNINMMYVIAY